MDDEDLRELWDIAKENEMDRKAFCKIIRKALLYQQQNNLGYPDMINLIKKTIECYDFYINPNDNEGKYDKQRIYDMNNRKKTLDEAFEEAIRVLNLEDKEMNM